MKKLIPVLILGCVLFFSCKKSVNANEEFYFRATINGQAINMTADLSGHSPYVNGTGSYEHSSIAMNPADSKYDYFKGTIFEKNPSALENAGVYVLRRYNGYPPTDAEERLILHTGMFGYGKSNIGGTTIQGAVIEYTDASGVFWTSEAGPQTGSTFEITEITDNATGASEKIFKANFSCKLYKETNPSVSITLVNGTVRGMAY